MIVAELRAAFLARRCTVCGAGAASVAPGSEAVYVAHTRFVGGVARSTRRMVAPAVPDASYCLVHAFSAAGERASPA